MPATRSATRARVAAATAATATPTLPVVVAKRPLKHQDPTVTKRPRKATKVDAAAEGGAPRPLIPPSGEELAPLPAELKFSMEDAKNHLIQADYRFGDMFSRLPCKPFETLEAVHPFRSVIRHHPIVSQSLTTQNRTLCSSIL